MSVRASLCSGVFISCWFSTTALAVSALPLDQGEFINTWSIQEATGRKRSLGTYAQAAERFDLRTALGRRFARKKYEISAVLDVSESQPGYIKLGCSRRCVLFLDGKRLGDRDVPHGAHLDDLVLPVHLAQGRHTIRVLVTARARRRRPQEVIVRIQSRENQPIKGLTQVFAPDIDVQKIIADRIAVTFASEVQDNGLQLVAQTQAFHTIPMDAELRLGGAIHAGIKSDTNHRLVVPVAKAAAPISATLTLRVGGRVQREVKHTIRPHELAVEALVRAQRALRRRSTAIAAPEVWDSIEYASDELLALVHTADKDSRWMDKRAKSLLVRSQALLDGHDPFASETGRVVRAYRSELDGRLQPYALYIPTGYLAQREWPLIAALHPSGYSPLLALRLVMGRAKKGSKRQLTRHQPKYRDRGAFVVAPYGYRGTGSRYFGKVDVLNVIDRVQHRYNIAADRVTLTGGSLGGLGSFHLGLRMPDRFNAIMPIAGYGSVRLYGDIMRKPRTHWEPFLIARRDNTTFVPNARHLFMHCIHGALDSPRRSEVIVDRYRKYGYRHRYDLLEDVGHNAWDDGYKNASVFRLNRRHRRPERPKRLTFVSGSYRHRAAYWLRVEQFDDHAAIARVDGRIQGKTMRLTTKNVRRLSVQLRGETPVIDGVRFSEGEGWTTFANINGSWELQAMRGPAVGEKRPGISGPLDDILYEPHVFVYGTADPAQTDTNRRRAKEAARYYWNSAEIQVPVVADSELTEQQRQSLHLVLVGNPRSNTVLAEIHSRLPVTFDAKGIEFRGKRYEGDSVGISFIYPNPMTEGQTYVKVHAGVTWRGTWLSGYLPRWGPDFLIYDEGIAVQRFGRLMDRRKPLLGGYFNRNWN